MEVNAICRNHDITIREVPAGTSLPEGAVATQEDIAILAELEWGLSYIQQFLELSSQMRSQLGQAGQTGGISDRAWGIWAEVSTQLVTETGVTAAALPLERVIQGVVQRLESETYPEKQADLTLLTAILTSYNQFLAAFHAALNSGNYPIASAQDYDATRSFKHNIRPILDRLNSALSQELQTEVNLSAINWATLSAATVEQVHGRVEASLRESCNDYAAAIPQPPEPEVPEQPQTPEPDFRRLEWLMSASPGYAFQLAGDTSAPIASGPILRGNAGLSLRLNPELLLQLTYEGGLGLIALDQKVSDMSSDSGIFSVRYNELVGQASFLSLRDFTTGNDAYLGTLAAGYQFFNGYVEPFGGGIVGADDNGLVAGGFLGLRSSQIWQLSDSAISRIGYRVDALGTLLYINEGFNARPGGTAAFVWHPVSFLGGDLEVAAQATGLYDTTSGSANITPAITLGWNSQAVIRPYPAILY